MNEQLKKIENEISRLKGELEEQPGNSRKQAQLGELLSRIGDYDGAVIHFKLATAIDPTLLDVQLRYANILVRQCNISGALASFSMVQVYKPQNWLRLKMALLLPPIVESVNQIAILRARTGQALRTLLADDNLEIHNPPRDGGSLFYVAYYGQDDRSLYEQLAQLYAKATPGLTMVAPHCDKLPADRGSRKIKVGFVSSFFFDHSIGRLNIGLIANLDREKFDVTLVVIPHKKDHMTQAISENADRTIEVPFDLATARDDIAEQEFDILVYPEIGMDIFTYSLACARLAPVQCVSWGHPVTTGIANMDYFVSSEELETQNSDAHYSEKLVRLGTLPPYYEKPLSSEKEFERAHFGLEEGVRYYLVAQYLFKIHPEFDAIMAAILERDPEGVVLLVHGTQPIWSNLIWGRFKRKYPDLADRLQFVNSRPRDEFLSFLSFVDVSLDIPHFNGGNTTIEALSVHTPVVTMPSEFMRGRVCAAIYKQIGLSDLIAETPKEYVNLAVQIATDDTFRKEVKDSIADKIDGFFENENVIREWENFFLMACEEKGLKRS